MPEATVHLCIAGDDDLFITYPSRKLALAEIDEFNRMMEQVSDDPRTSASIFTSEQRSQPLVDYVGASAEWAEELKEAGWTRTADRWSDGSGLSGLDLVQAWEALQG